MNVAVLTPQGTIELPKKLREQYGLEEGQPVLVEERPEGILLRRLTAPEGGVEEYTDERIAEFLLNNACSAEDYAWAREEAHRLGVDPDQVPHVKPPGM